MRFSLIALSTALFAVSTFAAPVITQAPEGEINSHITTLHHHHAHKHAAVPHIEQREPSPDPPKVSFSGGARKHLDTLGLHGDDRAKAKKWHADIVKDEMKKNGAASAQIKHLAHHEGSKDPNAHITTAFWDADGKRMKGVHGDPPKKNDLFHVYVPPNGHVNTAYNNAVKAKGKTIFKRMMD